MISYLKNNLLKKINLIINNTYLLFFFFIIIFSFITIIFCLLMAAQNPTIIDESHRMNIFAISNEIKQQWNFGHIHTNQHWISIMSRYPKHILFA